LCSKAGVNGILMKKCSCFWEKAHIRRIQPHLSAHLHLFPFFYPVSPQIKVLLPLSLSKPLFGLKHELANVN
ncbi:hypothetical protein, partial [Paenibacillus sp. 598K]|uniref:hypothetical protein n=1 Tax=Paenibacillus sp. 598K TaxID=1117987 RepID=UPI001C88B683